MSKNIEQKLSHTCFTRNDDKTRVLIDWDNGERCITGGTKDSFWDRKLCNELKRNRKSKKLAQKNLKKEKKPMGLIKLYTVLYCKYCTVNIIY